ncbi:MAG: VanZ family protein [Clostridia bacterium]|nr:VanZ family protein [Clostridia bacterium]
MNKYIRKSSRAVIALRVLFLALIVVNMTFIWFNSAKVSEESTKSSKKIAESITKQVVKDYDSLTKSEQKTHVTKMNTKIRSLAHFGEFIPLGMLFFLLALTLLVCPKGPWRLVLISLVFSVILSMLCALSDEIHQIFVKGRSFEVKDILTDTLGALCGCGLGILISVPFNNVKR